MSPEITIASQHIQLPEQAAPILVEMFRGEARLVITNEFTSSSLSGSWVYEVHVQRRENELPRPLVVKLASASLIEKEWQAFETCIRDHWPGVAQIRGEPVFLEGLELAGICYPLMGHQVFQMQSLRQYCLEAEVEDLRFVLEKRLLAIMREQTLLPAQVEFNRSLQAIYDPVLPVNLWVEPQALPPESRPTLITPGRLPVQPLHPGDPIRLEGFVVTKVDLRRRTVTLNLPPGSALGSYTLRLHLAGEMPSYKLQERLPLLEGLVKETRQSQLEREVASLLGKGFDPANPVVELPDGSLLPNPLQALATGLETVRHLKTNCIHGDMNLENILVDPQVRDVRLIDFAEAHRDYVLHDLLRLETEVVTKIIPPILVKVDLPATTITAFYQQLHALTFQPETPLLLPHPVLKRPLVMLSTLRQAAQQGLYDPGDFEEYYQGLVFYLLGALKFRNLDQAAKQSAFWGAATIQQLQQEPFLNSSKPVGLRARLSFPRRLIYGLALLGILAALLYGLFNLIDHGVSPSTEPRSIQALLVDFTPEVEVQRASVLQAAEFGMKLYQGDIVITSQAAAATLLFYCEEGLVVQLAAQQNMTVDCQQAETLPVIHRFKPDILSHPPPLTEGRGMFSRLDQTSLPLLTYPRNTVITDTRPNFTWQAVTGAGKYHITVIPTNGHGWIRLTETNQLLYPAGEPPLAPGEVATVTVDTDTSSRYANETFLRLLDNSSLAELAEAEAAIQKLDLSEPAYHYLLAQLYQHYELRAAAIRELAALVQLDAGASPYLQQELGQLYFDSGLYVQAERTYGAALQAARTKTDPLAQAAAQWGLARVAYLFGETQEAQKHCKRAETFARQGGEPVQPDQIIQPCSSLTE